MKATKRHNNITIHLPAAIASYGDKIAVVDAHGHVIQFFANTETTTGNVDDSPTYIAARAFANYINAVR